MIRQKAICVKVEIDQLARLDSLCNSLGCNRNKFINFAIKMVNDNMSCTDIRAYMLTSVYADALKILLSK